MKILLTGATGQLGKTILEQFTNCEFYAPTRDALDLTSLGSVKEAISAFEPDVVINSAAWTDVPAAEERVEETISINLKAVENLARASADLGARFIQVSTDFVFDGVTTTPYKEDSVKNPLSVYGKSKSEAEDYLLSEHPENLFIIRTSWLYSKYRRNFVKTILKKLLCQTTEVNVVSDQFGSPTLSSDLASALELYCKKDFEPGLYHFANSGVATWYTFAQKIAEYSDLNPDRVIPTATKSVKELVKRPAFSVLDTSKYTLATGNTPARWHESLIKELPTIRAEVESELLK